MKSIIYILLILLSSTLLSSQVVKQIDQTLRSAAEDLLTKKGFTIIDLATQEAVLQEQNSQEGCLDDGCFLDTGKMLAAKYLIVIHVSKLKEKEYFFKIKNVQLDNSAVLGTSTALYKGMLNETGKLLSFGKKQFSSLLVKMGTPKGNTPVMIHVILKDANLDMIKAMEACTDPTCGGYGVCGFNQKIKKAQCSCFAGYEVSSSGLMCEPICKPDYCGQNNKTEYHGREYQTGYCHVKNNKPVCTCMTQFGYEQRDDFQCVRVDFECPIALGMYQKNEQGKLSCKCHAHTESDGKGGCKLRCPPGTCGEHGTCMPMTGKCECHSGYQDLNHNLTCMPACQKTDCNDDQGMLRGTCNDQFQDQKVCACHPEYQDNDHNLSCMPACTPNSCLPGRCSDHTGKLVCGCPKGYFFDGKKSCVNPCDRVDHCGKYGACMPKSQYEYQCVCKRGKIFDPKTERCIKPGENNRCKEAGYKHVESLKDGFYTCDHIAIPVQMAAGSKHLCILFSDGSVQCKGRNFRGELGRGVKPKRSLRKEYKKFKSKDFLPVISSKTDSGAVVPLKGIIALFAGESATCGLRSDRKIVCWGSNQHEQIRSLKSPELRALVDAKMIDDDAEHYPIVVPDLGEGSDVALNTYFNCFINQKKEVWGQGTLSWMFFTDEKKGHLRQLFLDRDLKKPFTNAKHIINGKQHFCVITTDQKGYCFGRKYRDLFQLGRWHETLLTVNDVLKLKRINALALGASHGCVADHKSVSCWGKNNQKWELGSTKTRAGRKRYLISQFKLPKKVKQLAAGRKNSCALLKDGTVYCWGENRSQSLGVTSEQSQMPSRDPQLTKTTYHALVASWQKKQTLPVKILGIKNGVELVALNSAYCVRNKKHEVYCWGSGFKKVPTKLNFNQKK